MPKIPYIHFCYSSLRHSSFGMGMVGRIFSNGSEYRYGFNGKENDNKVKGIGNQQDYGMRIYDPRLGRFLSEDPLCTSFPWNSTYSFAENDVLRCVDIDGLEKYVVEQWHDKYGRAMKFQISGINSLNPKQATNMNLKSAMGKPLTDKDIYEIHYNRKSRLIDDNARKSNSLSPAEKRAYETASDNDNEGVDAKFDENTNLGATDQEKARLYGTKKGDYFNSIPNSTDETHAYFDSKLLPIKNTDPTNSQSLVVMSNQVLSSMKLFPGQWDQGTGRLNTDMNNSFSLNQISASIITRGKQFLKDNRLNLGFVENISLIAPFDAPGWQILKTNLEKQFNVKVGLSFDSNIMGKDIGNPNVNGSPQGYLHVSAKYTGVTNGSAKYADNGAISN